MRGNVREALAAMRRLEPLLDGIREPQIRVNALTFHADYLRAAGYYPEAAEKLARAERDAPDTMMRTRLFLVLISAHLRLSVGDSKAALDLAGQGVELTIGDSDPQAASAVHGWVSLVQTNAALDAGDLEAASRFLKVAESVPTRKWDHPLGAALTALHDVALLRAAGDYRECLAKAEWLLASTGRSAGVGALRKQGQEAGVARTDASEVALVEGRDLSDIESLSERDHGRVCHAQRKIRILPDELGDPRIVDGNELDWLEVAGGEAVEKGCFEFRRTVGLKHVPDLRGHGRRHKKTTTCQPKAREQLDAGVVVRISAQRCSNQRTGVAQDHPRKAPKPDSARYLSWFRARSDGRLSASMDPNQTGGQEPPFTGFA